MTIREESDNHDLSVSEEETASQNQETELNEITKLQTHIEQLKQELFEAKDTALRQAADYDNYRKRQQREREEERLYATQKLLKDLITVLDNFDRALAASQSNDQAVTSLRQGIQMVADQLTAVTVQHGLQSFSSLGQVFDPNRHEAIAERAEGIAGTVIEEYQKGYTLHERVVRPAMVAVSKGTMN